MPAAHHLAPAPFATMRRAALSALMLLAFGAGVSHAAATSRAAVSAVASSKAEAELPVAKTSGADEAKLAASLAGLGKPDPILGTTQALLILRNGAIAHEYYGPMIDKDAKLNTWTISQSLSAVAVGRAVELGLLKSLDEPAGLTDWKIAADGRQNITIRNLLQMNAGLGWSERKAGSPAGSDAEKMFFGTGQRDVLGFAAGKKARTKPGEVFQYSSGSGVLMAAALQRRLAPFNAADGKRTYALQKLMTDDLFAKVGMAETAPQFDIVGNAYASSLTWSTARDLARFGQFCLKDGVWNKERLLPEGWIKLARTPSGAKGGGSYGAGFWIKAAKPDETDALMAALPADAFAAGGDRGAVIVMVPSKDLVIVRLGITTWGEKPRAALGAWLGQVAAAFPDSQIK